MARDIPGSIEKVDAKTAALWGLQASVERQAAATGFTAYSLYCLMVSLKLTPVEFRQSVKDVLPQFVANQVPSLQQKMVEVSVTNSVTESSTCTRRKLIRGLGNTMLMG